MKRFNLFSILCCFSALGLNAQVWSHHLDTITYFDGYPAPQSLIGFDSTNNRMVTTNHLIDIQNSSAVRYSNSVVPPVAAYIRTDSKGHTWVSAPGAGAFEYDGTQIHDRASYSSNQASLYQIQRNSKGEIWFTTMWGNKSTHIYTGTKDSIAHNFEPDIIREDEQGNMWIAGCRAGMIDIYKWDGNAWTNYNNMQPQIVGVSSHIVTDLVVDQSGIIWLAVKGRNLNYSGALFYSSTGTTWQKYTTADGLPHNNLNALAIDNDGLLWIATENGLSLYDGLAFKSWTASDWGVNPSVSTGKIVNDVAVDKNNDIWIATRGIHTLSYKHPTSVIKIKEEAVKSRITVTPGKDISITFNEKLEGDVLVSISTIDGKIIQQNKSKITNSPILIKRNSNYKGGYYMVSVSFNNHKESSLVFWK